MKGLNLIFFTSIALLLGTPAYAAITQTSGTFNATRTGVVGPEITDGIYLRDIYDRTLRPFTIVGSVSNQTPLLEGETWILSTLRDGEPVNGVVLELKLRNGCLQYHELGSIFWYSLGRCVNQVDPDDPNYVEEIAVKIDYSIRARCFDQDSDYQMVVAHGQNSFQGIQFSPMEQKAGRIQLISVNASSMISPLLDEKLAQRRYLPGGLKLLDTVDAGAVTYLARVTDNWLCQDRIPGVKVVVHSETENQILHGHKHFDDGNPGTGHFTQTEPPVSGEAISIHGSRVEGITDENGEFTFTYTAGTYSVNERLFASITDGVFGNEEIRTAAVRIELPGFVRLDTIPDLLFLGSFGPDGTCDKEHNDGDGLNPSDRRSVYVTQLVREDVEGLDNEYSALSGHHLCLNDASLRYGGFFDNGNPDLNVPNPPPDQIDPFACHESHRRGLDVDINVLGPGHCPEDLLNETMPCPAIGVGDYRKVECLEEIAKKAYRAYKEIEPSLHFRFRP